MTRSLILIAAAALAAACSPQAAGPVEPASAETSQPADGEAVMHTITFQVEVPEGSGPVYIAGNLPELGPWAADGLLLDGEGEMRTTTLSIADGTAFEYKFTLGTWAREGLADDGGVPRNFELLIDGSQSVSHRIDHWKADTIEYVRDWENSGVLGQLVYWENVESEHLGPARHVEIWLPPGYETGEFHYPVIYMHDGQNLFDPRIANTGVDWGVDEAIVRGMEAGTIRPAIVVGIWSGDLRGPELSPWADGSDYGRFIIEEVMPRVNAEFRTLTGPENTFTMGSSMGGLISLHLVRTRPDVFGACGCISTHFPYNADVHAQITGEPVPAGVDPERALILDDIEAGARVPDGVRMWFDYGTETLDSIYEPSHLAVRDWLLDQGLVEGEDFVVRRYDGAAHNEASWRARLDDPITFLLGLGPR